MSNDITPVPLRLSEVKVDFEALVLQFQMYLAQKESWKDLNTSGTGQALVEMLGGLGAYLQFGINSSAREAFPSTALRDSSIYAASRMLGVNIGRKEPAGTTVTLTRTGSLVSNLIIPAYTVWTVDGKAFFNRTALEFAALDNSISATLYEGEYTMKSYVATSEAFSEIILGEPGFVVSNLDVQVKLRSTTNVLTTWTSISDGIWTAGPTDNVFFTSTTGTGDVSLSFGDGYHGSLPSLGHTIEVYYVITKGAEGYIEQVGLEAKCDAFSQVTGVTTTAVSGGANEKPAAFYKFLAPQLFRARRRCVTKADYKAVILEYPDVASVQVLNQKDIDPMDINYMNVVQVCVLPKLTNTWTTPQINAFLAWLDDRKHLAIDVHFVQPIAQTVNFVMVVYTTLDADQSQTIADTKAAVQGVFAKDIGTIGKRIALSDVIKAVTSLSTVDYVDITTPSVLGDFIPSSSLHYYKVGTVTVTAEYTTRGI